jgi:hypothetical protein
MIIYPIGVLNVLTWYVTWRFKQGWVSTLSSWATVICCEGWGWDRTRIVSVLFMEGLPTVK